MLAVHFGAGNIGRGFIGALLSQSGYKVCFVDIHQPLINAINERNEYIVVHASDFKEESYVKNISGLNSASQAKEVVEMIAQADLVTTAVGPNVLAHIADLVANGIIQRISKTDKPLNVIACENVIGASSLLKEYVFRKLTTEETPKVEKQIGFPNCTVDRIVPDQNHGEPLKVIVEPFYEWIVDESSVVGNKPAVEGITYVQELTPFIERKLYTVNTGHTVAAYLGYYYQYSTIREAMEQKKIRQVVEGALHETGALLIKKYEFDQEAHRQYIQKIIKRFDNPHISDEVTRVGRGPIRKLGNNDRLIGPAKQLVEQFNEQPRNLVLAIAAALLYDYAEDQEAVELQKMIAAMGLVNAISHYSGLPKEHDLVQMVVKQYDQLSVEGLDE